MAWNPNRKVVTRIAGLAAGMLALGALVLWAVPLLLTASPSAGLTTAERLKAVNDARQTVVTFLVVIGAGGTLWFTARTYLLNRESNVTDRFTKAVAQLGDDTVHVRVGAIYAMERLGHDSVRDRRTAVYVLGAFIRGQSRLGRPAPETLAEDVYTAIQAINRLSRNTDAVINLRGADLSYADLSKLPPGRTWLEDAKTDHAKLPGTTAS